MRRCADQNLKNSSCSRSLLWLGISDTPHLFISCSLRTSMGRHHALEAWNSTWRILRVGKQLVAPIYKPFRSFGRGPTTPVRGRKQTMVINHLLSGMILQIRRCRRLQGTETINFSSHDRVDYPPSRPIKRSPLYPSW